MSSSDDRQRKPKPLLIPRAAAPDEPKTIVVPEHPAAESHHDERAIVPFVVIEYERKEGSSIGILMLEQAVA